MAEKDKKYSDNVPGKYYVDDKCIACDACVGEAPKNFTMNNNEGHSKVAKQPESPEEDAACKAAMSACPVEAIGDDGE